MSKVSNKKVIRHIAIQMLKANKARNIAVILAIVLTTTMFTTVFSIAASMMETIEQSTMRQVGGSDMAGFKYGRLVDYEILKKDSKVKDISYRILVGVLANEEVRDIQSEVYYSQAENAKSSYSYPTEGHLPEKKNEVAMSSVILDGLGIKAEIGAAIPLEIMVGDKVYQKNFVLCGYWKGDPVMSAQMVYVSKECQEELAPEHDLSYYDTESAQMAEGYYSIDFNFASKINIEGQVRDLLERNGYDPDKYSYGVNWAYMTSTVDDATVFLVVSVLLMIFIAGYLIIYNIFYIGVIAGIHEFGLLKTIGTSEKQIKRMIRIQGNVYSVVGIPMGLIIGTIVAKAVFPLILGQASVSESAICFSINPAIYIGATLFVLFTVFVGCNKPGKIAGRISPIEATKYENTFRVKHKKQRTKKVSIPYLAFQNLRREWKKAGTVILSLALSVLLVNGIVAVTNSLNPDLYVSQSIIGDYNISDGAFQNNLFLVDDTTVVKPEELKELNKIDGIEAVNNVYVDTACWIDLKKEQVQKLENLLPGNEDSVMAEDIRYDINSKSVEIQYYGIDEGLLDEINIRKGDMDIEKWNTGDYAICNSYELISDSTELGLIDIGDEVTVHLPDGSTKTYQVLAIGKIPYALSAKFQTVVGGSVIVPADSYKEAEDTSGALVSVLTVKPDQEENVDAAIQKLINRYPHLTSVSKETFLKEFHDFIRTIQTVGFGLAAILAIIGIINFCNTMITSIYKRSKEFAIMQAVGLTNRQLNSILMMEGMMYGVLTVIFSVFTHLLIGERLIEFMAGQMWMFEYQPTILPIFLCLPFILVFAVMIPYGVGKKLKRMSIIERISQDIT